MRMVTLRSIEIKDFSTSKWTSLLYLRWNPTMTLNIGTNLQCLARQVSNMWEIYLQIMLTFSDNQIILSEMCYNLKYCWEYQFQKAFFLLFFLKSFLKAAEGDWTHTQNKNNYTNKQILGNCNLKNLIISSTQKSQG